MVNNKREVDAYFEDDEYFDNSGVNGSLTDKNFNVETAPELHFASSLNPRKMSHILIALIMLIAVLAFVASSLLQILI